MNPKLKLAAAALAGIVLTVAVGGIATATMDKGIGHFRGADADSNGEITRAEWLQAAGTSFDGIDANKDGKLVVGEIPPERRGGPRHHGGKRDRDRDDRWGPDAPPPPAEAAPAGNVAAPAQ